MESRLMGTDQFEEALHFAVDAHSGMMRKSMRMPYILHPLEVAVIAASMSSDLEVLMAAVLHDVVEDTPVTLEEIRDRFGDRVMRLVYSETENKRPDQPAADTWQIRKEESLEVLQNSDRDVKILWLSDKLSNMRAFHRTHLKRGDEMWNDFNQKDPAKQAWYYRRIKELTEELSDQRAWNEYTELMELVFEGVSHG